MTDDKVKEAAERVQKAMKFTTQLRAKDSGFSTVVTVEFEDLYVLQAEMDKLAGEAERLTELHAARFREQQRYVSLYHAERIAKEAAEAEVRNRQAGWDAALDQRDVAEAERDKLSGEVERLRAEVVEADLPDIVEAGRLGAKLSPAEQAAWTGYELGWRDGARDHGNELAAMDREARGYADMAEAADLRAEAAEAERDKLSAEVERLTDENDKLRGMPDDDRKSCIALMEMLAEARADRDAYRKTMEAMVEAPDAIAKLLADYDALRAKLTALVEALADGSIREESVGNPDPAYRQASVIVSWYGEGALARKNALSDALRALSAPPTTPTSAPGEDVGGLVAELSNLLERATPGPWELQDGCSWRRIGTREHDGNVLCPTKNPRDGHPDLMAGRGEDTYANLNLICAAVNALPALLAALSPSLIQPEAPIDLDAWRWASQQTKRYLEIEANAHIPAPPVDAERFKTIVERKGYCFECGHELHAPFCPACNPEMIQPQGEERS